MESFGKSLCALSVILTLIHLLMQGALQAVPPLTCFLSFLHRFCIIEQLESKFDFHLDCTLRGSLPLSFSPGSVSCWGTIECNEPFLSLLCFTSANAKFALRTITLSHLVDVPKSPWQYPRPNPRPKESGKACKFNFCLATIYPLSYFIAESSKCFLKQSK